MTTIYVEAQYDPRRREQLLQASSGFGDPQPHRVTVRDVDADAGYQAHADFVQMYRRLGSTVVANGKNGHILTLEPIEATQ